MRRRRFLAAVGVGAIAGCASDGGSTPTPKLPAQYRPETGTVGIATEEVTETPRPTATEAPAEGRTPTATAVPEAPDVLDVDLVSEWDAFGDIDANEQESVRPGALVAGAARFSIPVHDGRVRARVEARALRDDTLVDEGTERVDAETDAGGTVEWEAAVGFATGPWEDATHTLEVRVHDPVTGLASESATTTFQVLAAAGN